MKKLSKIAQVTFFLQQHSQYCFPELQMHILTLLL